MYRRDSDVSCGSIIGVLFIFACAFAVIFIYVGTIGLFIISGIGVAVGFVYALYIYINSFIAAAKSLTVVSSTNLFKTTMLRWFTLFKNASRDAFAGNIAVAKNALIKSGTYRFLSLRKWLWLIVAQTTFIFGSILIVLIVILQALMFIAALWIVSLAIIALCALLFAADVVYSAIATGKNIKSVFAGKDNLFECFEFNLSARFSSIPSSIKNYFAILFSYMKGLAIENFELGKSNIKMSSGYRLLSLRRCFLCVSIVTLMLMTMVVNLLMLIVASVAFILLLISIIIWTMIAKFIGLISHKS